MVQQGFAGRRRSFAVRGIRDIRRQVAAQNGMRGFAIRLGEMQHQVSQPPRPHQCRIDRVHAVGCGQNDDIAALFKAIQLGHE